jgi:hypothetical protein
LTRCARAGSDRLTVSGAVTMTRSMGESGEDPKSVSENLLTGGHRSRINGYDQINQEKTISK